MKVVSLKNTSMTASFLVAVGYAGITLAHAVNGVLGASAGATDVYEVTCSNEDGGTTPTDRLSSRVKDNAPVAAPLISVSTSKGCVFTNTIDCNGDGNTSFGAKAYLSQGNGLYIMSVKKSAAGTELYTVEFHCEGPPSSGFIHTGTASRQIQNQ